MATPTDPQVGVEFLTKIGYAQAVSSVDTTADTITVDDPGNVMGGELASGDALNRTYNSQSLTVSSVTLNTDSTVVTVNEDLTDATATGTLEYTPKVGGSTSATRTRSVSMVDTTSKDSGRWQEQVPATQEETIEFDAMFLEGGSEQTGLGLTVEIDSGSGFNSLKGVNSVTASITNELITVANNDTARWAEREPSTRSAEFSVDRDYIDPVNDTAYSDILTAADNGNTVAVKVTLQTFTLTFDCHMTEESLESPHDDLGTSPITLSSTGPETTLSRSNQQDGVGNLFAAIFADPSQQMRNKIHVVDPSGNLVTGATSYLLDTYPESLEVEFPVEDAASVSGTLMNDGAPTRTTQ